MGRYAKALDWAGQHPVKAGQVALIAGALPVVVALVVGQFLGMPDRLFEPMALAWGVQTLVSAMSIAFWHPERLGLRTIGVFLLLVAEATYFAGLVLAAVYAMFGGVSGLLVAVLILGLIPSAWSAVLWVATETSTLGVLIMIVSGWMAVLGCYLLKPARPRHLLLVVPALLPWVAVPVLMAFAVW